MMSDKQVAKMQPYLGKVIELFAEMRRNGCFDFQTPPGEVLTIQVPGGRVEVHIASRTLCDKCLEAFVR